SRRQAYQLCGQPWTSSSGGPSPPVTACRRSSPVSTYRLVNVPVNPAGRFGAPETERGPSGLGRRVEDELTTVPLLTWPDLASAHRAAHRCGPWSWPWSSPWSVPRSALGAHGG